MNDGLSGLFASLAPLPAAERAAGDFELIAGLYSAAGLELAALNEPARRLFELSVNAFDAIVHAWMSELPIRAEALRYGRKVLAAADRAAAETAAADRGDPDALAVLEAAYKVRHEVDRLRGLLRFSPGRDGVYAARCEPDHFVLPALAGHFTQRFGDTPWVIIDEKRRLCLRRNPGAAPALCETDDKPAPAARDSATGDPWERLWQQYHTTINNESRNNPALQRRFMPKRYWKYLPEL